MRLFLALLLFSTNAFSVVPVIRSAQSGPWSVASTWEGGKLPGEGVAVLIRDGHTIIYDSPLNDIDT